MIGKKSLIIFCVLLIIFNNNGHYRMKTQTSSTDTHYLYDSSIGYGLRFIITKPWASKLAGWYANTRMSKMHIRPFIKKYNINMQEAAESNPASYRSFNEFFYRKLKPEARPLNSDANSVMSPADGQLFVVQNLKSETKFFIKNSSFNIAHFLQDNNLAQDFIGGTALIIYLAPYDYHRFHLPLDAQPTLAKHIAGKLESVHPNVYHSTQPLHENERHLILLKTSFSKPIAFVAVGALFVGSITQTYTSEQFYKKGDELGYFSFGGSTVVLLFPPNMIKIEQNLKNSDFVPIKMGQKIGTLID